MKVLFLSQVLPYPLDAGPKVRDHYVLRYLVERHTVTLVSFVRSSDAPESIETLKDICGQVFSVPMRRARWRDALALVRSLVTGEPVLIARDRVPEMDAALRRVVQAETFDVIHAGQLWMAPYALRAAQLARQAGGHPRLILDQHNAVFQIPERMAANQKWAALRWFLRREATHMLEYELSTCAKFDQVVWVTREDLQALRGKGRLAQTHNTVIPICVDPLSVMPVEMREEARDILFLGGMHWPPNTEGVRWFWREIFPLIRAGQTEARFVAVGKTPPADLAGEDCITPGFVEDVAPYWRAARVFVVPLLSGGGMRIKILDAWAQGLPVVSTTIGAEGIDYHAGEDILIADTPAEFSQAVLRLLVDPALAQRMGAAGRAAVEQRYDWRKVYSAWDELYADPQP